MGKREAQCTGGNSVEGETSRLWMPKEGDSKPFDVFEDCPTSLGKVLKDVDFCGPDDPAFFVVFTDNVSIHAAMGIAGSPVPEAAGAATTAANFKAFVSGHFRHADPNRIGIHKQPGGPLSDEVFQRLSNHEVGDITNWSVTNCLAWAAAATAAGHRTGKLYKIMTPVAGGAAGNGRSPPRTTGKRRTVPHPSLVD